ncbi:MAG: DCC1-like thiol-disulfide oxidoreductase family protein [Phycisphaerales bacterium]
MAQMGTDGGAAGDGVGGVVVFDGVCNLCNGWVRFVIRRDPAGRFRFAPFESAAARSLLGDEGAGGAGAAPQSVVLVQGGAVYRRSAAVLRIARGLRFPWWVLGWLIVVPRPARDWAYGVVAKRRYRWFGKAERCMVPTPEVRGRFLA